MINFFFFIIKKNSITSNSIPIITTLFDFDFDFDFGAKLGEDFGERSKEIGEDTDFIFNWSSFVLSLETGVYTLFKSGITNGSGPDDGEVEVEGP